MCVFVYQLKKAELLYMYIFDIVQLLLQWFSFHSLKQLYRSEQKWCTCIYNVLILMKISTYDVWILYAV